MCLGEIGIVTDIWAENEIPMARLENGDAVCALYEPAVQPGAHVLIHLGFIVDLLTEQQATEAAAFRRKGMRDDANG